MLDYHDHSLFKALSELYPTVKLDPLKFLYTPGTVCFGCLLYARVTQRAHTRGALCLYFLPFARFFVATFFYLSHNTFSHYITKLNKV